VSGSKDLAVSGQIQLSISTLGTSRCSVFWQSRVVGYSLFVIRCWFLAGKFKKFVLDKNGLECLVFCVKLVIESRTLCTYVLMGELT